MKISELTGLGISTYMNKSNALPKVPFYSLEGVLNNGNKIGFDQYAGKHILIVNLASNCGYTNQYSELEALYQAHKNDLVVLGFPSNDFGGQEPGSDEDIAEFCRVNYGVQFPVFKKDSVDGSRMQPVYQWLTDPEKNGWNARPPSWNFCKYLVNRKGILTDYFSAAVSPFSTDIINRLF